MRITTALLLLGVACWAAAAQAQQKTDIVSAMNNNGHKLAVAVLDIAGVTKHASDPKARYTFLLPTDAAIEAFLKDMGLTVDDLKKRPILAKSLVAQHTLLRSNVREQEIFAKGETRKAATLAALPGKEDIEFKRSAAGKYTVTDPQGFSANVGKPIHPDDNKTILPIDRVLLGSDYYTSFDAACKHRADRISSFCEAVKTTGLASALSPKGGLDATVFVPNNAAFAKVQGKPSTEALTKILKYHVVPGAREVPKQWKNGASFPTLLGKDLKVNYARISAAGTKAKYDWAEARVVPADGQEVPVLKANVHVGKAIVNGIGTVLNPDAAAKAAAPAATSTEKGSKTGSRKLLGWDWGFQGGPTAAGDDAASNIQNAVMGNESVASAANQNLLGAEELSVPGDYAQVMNGVQPW